MSTSDRTSARFRSATEFPRTVDHLSSPDANKLYGEMRDCLIFTNRSRAQLLRRNKEHKEFTLQLKADVERLQILINKLTIEKQQLVQSNQNIVSELEHEISAMTTHLDRLSTAFDPVSEDLENPTQMYWNFLALPRRFLDFIRTVKAVVLSWREERGNDLDGTGNTPVLGGSPPQLPSASESDDERRKRPQMYTDTASINRDLLDR
ncbi:MAG: hypothetical protein ACRDEA_07595 [Microcystaceae cyanobacterium]